MISLLLLGLPIRGLAQQQSVVTDTSLAKHDFFYAGQSKQRRMFIVKNGQVTWAYQD